VKSDLKSCIFFSFQDRNPLKDAYLKTIPAQLELPALSTPSKTCSAQSKRKAASGCTWAALGTHYIVYISVATLMCHHLRAVAVVESWTSQCGFSSAQLAKKAASRILPATRVQRLWEMCNRRDFDVDVDAPWPDSLGADRSSSDVEQLSQVPGLRHLSIRWLFAMQFLIAAKKCIPALTFFFGPRSRLSFFIVACVCRFRIHN